MSRIPRILLVVIAAALVVPASAAARDRNHDRIPDRWERAHHLSLGVNQAPRDQDRDGLNNLSEFQDHTNPRKADSDGDGTTDGLEDGDGDGASNVVEQEDGPGDGSGDREHGDGARLDHVVSYDDGTHVLTLGRADGSSVIARLGGRALVACAVALPGPFAPCAPGSLAAGAPVAVAVRGEADGGPVWSVVLLLVAPAAGAAPAAPQGGDGPPPPSPSGQSAPPATGTISSFANGVLTVGRPSGEKPSAPLAGSVQIRCLGVSGGVVVSDEPCTAERLVPGAQIAVAQIGTVDGGPKWVKVVLLAPKP